MTTMMENEEIEVALFDVGLVLIPDRRPRWKILATSACHALPSGAVYVPLGQIRHWSKDPHRSSGRCR